MNILSKHENFWRNKVPSLLAIDRILEKYEISYSTAVRVSVADNRNVCKTDSRTNGFIIMTWRILMKWFGFTPLQDYADLKTRVTSY